MFEVRDLAREDDVRAGILLGKGFVDDPVWRMFGPRWRRHRLLVAILFHIGEVVLCRRRGGWLVAGYEDGRMVGVTVAFPRGEEPMPWLYWVTRTIAFVLAGPLPGLRALRLQSQLDAVHPKEPHVHCWLLGAEPETRGVGAVILREVTQRADRLGRRCYLEATASHLVSLYGLLGFEQSGRVVMSNGDPIVLMWRPLATSGAGRGAGDAREVQAA